MRRFKRILTVFAALALLAIGYRVLGVYRFRQGECSARKTTSFTPSYPKHLTVMTFNIEGHASLLRSDHIAQIADVINRHHPDLVGVNEAHRNTWQSRFHDHTQELSQRTGMNVVFGRSYRFAGGDFGNAVLTRGRLVGSDVYELPGTGEPRSMLETRIAINGGLIEFYVTHVAAWASLGIKTRDLQLQCVADHLKGSTNPYIMTGDLNAPPDSPEIAKFLQSTPVQFAGDAQAPTHKLMEKRLDYILIDKGWVVRSSQVLDEGPSDHRPVLVELVHP
jgi:endonuclease/exonuclease/phosphatase family metal-dependent hydrolase